MREIVFDTETTGLDPAQGHRLIELGCIELVNRFPTGNVFHRYFNPERDVPQEAFRIHGLSAEFLKTHPLFATAVAEFLEFVGDAPLVAHNGFFDLGFINSELARAGKEPFGRERIVDTLVIARRKHPGGNNKLDDLCVRYRIDNSRRTKHGALLDAELLAEVYIELTGARQVTLGFDAAVDLAVANGQRMATPVRAVALPPRLTEQEQMAHEAFVATLGDETVWSKYR